MLLEKETENEPKRKMSLEESLIEDRNENVKTTTPSMFEGIYYDKKLREAFENFLASEFNKEPWLEILKN
jgi:hypothetical protein